MRTEPQTADASPATTRDLALDMVKGLLVLGMLLIHASNFFVDSPGIQRFVYPRLLGFVSGSWLCISGYIVGLRYRFLFVRDPRKISRRLIGRGWRLVAIFVVSNLVLGNLSLPACFGSGPDGGCSLVKIFVLGDDRQAFEVLLGIGYLLLIAPLCLWLPTVLLAGLALCLIVGLSVLKQAGGPLPLLAWMLACGIAGIIIGSLVRPAAIQAVLDNPRARLMAISLALLTWGITEALFVARTVSNVSPAFYIPHVVSALTVLYVMGVSLAGVAPLRRPLALMAHYSLLAYMGQMAILLALAGVAARWPVAGFFPLSVVVSLITLLGGLYLLSALRLRFAAIDRIYQSVFS